MPRPLVFFFFKPENTAQVQRVVILVPVAPQEEGAGEGLGVLGQWAARPEIHPCVVIPCYVNSGVPFSADMAKLPTGNTAKRILQKPL